MASTILIRNSQLSISLSLDSCHKIIFHSWLLQFQQSLIKIYIFLFFYLFENWDSIHYVKESYKGVELVNLCFQNLWFCPLQSLKDSLVEEVSYLLLHFSLITSFPTLRNSVSQPVFMCKKSSFHWKNIHGYTKKQAWEKKETQKPKKDTHIQSNQITISITERCNYGSRHGGIKHHHLLNLISQFFNLFKSSIVSLKLNSPQNSKRTSMPQKIGFSQKGELKCTSSIIA